MASAAAATPAAALAHGRQQSNHNNHVAWAAPPAPAPAPPPLLARPRAQSDQALAAEALLPLLDYLDAVRAAEGEEQPAPEYDDGRAGACAEAAAEAAAGVVVRRAAPRAAVATPPENAPPPSAAATAPPPASEHYSDAADGGAHHSSGGGSYIVVRHNGDSGGGTGSNGNGNGNGAAAATAPPPAAGGSSVAQRLLHLARHGRGSRHFAPDELRRGLDRLWQAATRGAAVGLTLRGGLHAMGALASLAAAASARGGGRSSSSSRPSLPPRRRSSSSLSAADAIVDTLRYGAFLGALAGVMVGADEAIAAAAGRRHSARWRAFLAGVCAGPSLLLTGPQSRHYSLATYVLLRGVTLLVRVGNKRIVVEDREEADEQQQHREDGGDKNNKLPPRRLHRRRRLLRALLWPTRLRHGDVLLMCLACSQILYAFIMEPASLPPSYVRFILRQGAKDPAVWAGIREVAARTRRAETAARAAGLVGAEAARRVAAEVAASPLRALAGSPALVAASEAARAQVLAVASASGAAATSPASGRGLLQPLACAFFHPGESCPGHVLHFVFPGAWLRALRVYVPVYLLPMLLVHRGRLLSAKEALPLLGRAATGVARSSLFLSLAIGLAFGGACAGFRLNGHATGAVVAAFTWPAGLATLAEKKSRRMELALYVAARSLESLARCLAIWGYVPGLGGGGGTGGGGGMAAGATATPALRNPRSSSSSSRRPPLLLALRPLLAAALARYDVLLFALGCGAIAHCYGGCRGEHRDVFRSKYLAVLDFVFGSTGFSAGAVRHEPSNAELISRAGMRVARSINRISSLTGMAGLGLGGGAGSGGSLAALAAAGGTTPTPVRRPSRLAPPPPSPPPMHALGDGGGGSGSGSSSTSSIGSNSSGGGGGGAEAAGDAATTANSRRPEAAAGAPTQSPSFVSAASGGVGPSSSVATFATATSREGTPARGGGGGGAGG
jgi:hypothetical protein